MRTGGWLLQKQICACLVLILSAPTVTAALPAQDPAAVQQQQSAASNGAQNADSSSVKPMPDSAQPDATLPDAPEVAQAQTPSFNAQSSSSQPSQDQQQNGSQQPVGTAAAPGITRTGVAASKPAGAAIAPAKQRRVRTIMISLAVVAAAGVAVGAVAGISRTSPSQPK